MQKLIELAKKIKDKELRKKVVDFLKDPKLSHPDFKKYPKEKIEEARAVFTVVTPQGPLGAERDVLNHTVALVDLCEKTSDNLEKNYKILIDRDSLIAGALLHDICKIFEWKKTKEGFEPTGILLDHTMLGTAEFYHREFPEKVIHLVASHFGESGPTPPRNFEAMILHHCDSFLSLTETRLQATIPQQELPLMVLDEESLKKMIKEAEKKK
jgi:7,8-dihydroneopterin 2',3'-cyclic phosphate phosphodiesterase